MKYKKYDYQLSFRMTNEIKDFIDKMADMYGFSKGQTVYYILKRVYDGYEQGKKENK